MERDYTNIKKTLGGILDDISFIVAIIKKKFKNQLQKTYIQHI